MYSPRIAYLEYALATKTPFVSYRMPNESDYYTLLLDSEEGCIAFDSFETIAHEKGIVFTPFVESDENPSLLIKYKELCVNDKGFRGDMFLDKTVRSNNSKLIVTSETKEKYASEFEAFYEKIKKGELEKVILSKTISYEGIDEIQAVYTFHNLAENYNDAFVYWVYLPSEGIVWMGATPELLLKEAKDDFQTVSLAGTKMSHEKWGEKEKEEQQIVTKYIENELHDFEVKVSETKTLKHGDIEHLINYITIKKSKNSLPKLLKRLHPTPAVCGFPKDKAFRAINTVEKHSREYYCGVVGVLNMEQTALFVNLRCMKIAQTQLQLYVGGGLTVASSMEKEWQETERKADTLRKTFC